MGVDLKLHIYFVRLFPAGPPFPVRLDHCASPEGLVRVSPLSWTLCITYFYSRCQQLYYMDGSDAGTLERLTRTCECLEWE